jgi:septal ring factor EnvC (AmiA/AmiB activator)
MRSVNLACRECCAWATEVEEEWKMRDELRAQLQALRAELDRANVDANAWSNRAHKAETMLDRARAEARDLERENASLRRRLREGGR